VLPLWGLGVGGTLLVKSGVVAYAITVGDGSPMSRLHVNIGVPGYFATHILAGTVALLIGTWQLSTFLRERLPNAHRVLGWIYVVLVTFSAIASLFLSPRLDILGTMYLRMGSAVLWLAFTALAIVTIRAGDVVAHRRWMLRSYAFAFMGISFIAYSWLGDLLQLPLAVKYPMVLWMTFLTNVLAVETYLARSRPLPVGGGLRPEIRHRRSKPGAADVPDGRIATA
jgi:uncharacterized membrane protein